MENYFLHFLQIILESILSPYVRVFHAPISDYEKSDYDETRDYYETSPGFTVGFIKKNMKNCFQITAHSGSWMHGINKCIGCECFRCMNGWNVSDE